LNASPTRHSRAHRIDAMRRLEAIFKTDTQSWLTVTDVSLALGVADTTARLYLANMQGNGFIEEGVRPSAFKTTQACLAYKWRTQNEVF
jgi:response regulator of citrate/malate metabolism